MINPLIVMLDYFWNNQLLDDLVFLSDLDPVTTAIVFRYEYHFFISGLQEISNYELMIVTIQS